jgi:FlaA1/EpsC-like NDP-sugar epimerase
MQDGRDDRSRRRRDGRAEAALRRFVPYAQPWKLGADLACVIVACTVSMLIRTIDADYPFERVRVAAFLGLAMAGFAAIGWFEGLYRGRFRYGSFDEIAALIRTAALLTACLVVANRLIDQLVPTSVTFLTGASVVVLTGGVRYAWRLVRERSMMPAQSAAPVIVVGAGEAGEQLTTAMRRNPQSPYRPVAFVDDDPAKRRLRINGIPVVGTTARLEDAADELGVRTAVVAIPSADGSTVRRLTQAIREAGLEALVLPPVGELLDSTVALEDVRPPTEADLLGRREVNIDIDSVAGYLTGRRVLVTGAGGSIGSELCHQIQRFGPERLIMLDRDESALHAVQLRLEGRAMLDSRDLVVADIRDRHRMMEVFDEHRPHVVFHAAALKHLPLLEMHPEEAVKTNIVGTQHVLNAAVRSDVDHFVNISTDKAAAPVSVLGYSKRIAERLTAHAAVEAPGTFVSVRFGNVLGSRGSVLTAFRSQIEGGGPVTVTHPDVTRYFMTVEEAVQLVIQAAAVGRSGDALVLDMGEPVRIADVARQMASAAPRPVEVVFTGLRPGEKLHEQLLGEGEIPVGSAHELITAVRVPPIRFDQVLEALPSGGPAVAAGLARVVAR